MSTRPVIKRKAITAASSTPASVTDLERLFTELSRGRKDSGLVKLLDAKPHFLALNIEALRGPVLSKMIGYTEKKSPVVTGLINSINQAISDIVSGKKEMFIVGNTFIVDGEVIKNNDHLASVLRQNVRVVKRGKEVVGIFCSSFKVAQGINASLSDKIAHLIDTLPYQNTLVPDLDENKKVQYDKDGNVLMRPINIDPGLDVGHTIIRKGELAGQASTPLLSQLVAIEAALQNFLEPGQNFIGTLPERITRYLRAGADYSKVTLSSTSNVKETLNEVSSIISHLDSIHSYDIPITTDLDKDFTAALLSIKGEINIVVPQDRLENQRFWGTNIEGKLSTKLAGILAKLRFSNNMIDEVQVRVTDAIVGALTPNTKSKKVIKLTVTSPVTAKKAGITAKSLITATSKLKNLNIRTHKGQFTSLASIQVLLNQALATKIKENMGTPALNNRTGRFAESAKVVNVSQSRQGMITAFYSYMKNPYQTFEPGFAQGSERRNPKTLISKSIREIASGLVGNRLRAVSI